MSAAVVVSSNRTIAPMSESHGVGASDRWPLGSLFPMSTERVRGVETGSVWEQSHPGLIQSAGRSVHGVPRSTNGRASRRLNIPSASSEILPRRARLSLRPVHESALVEGSSVEMRVWHGGGHIRGCQQIALSRQPLFAAAHQFPANDPCFGFD